MVLWYVPVSLAVDLLKVDALVYDPMFASGILKPWQANPDLVVEHPEQQSRKNHEVPHIHLAPALRRQPIEAVYDPRCHHNILLTLFRKETNISLKGFEIADKLKCRNIEGV